MARILVTGSSQGLGRSAAAELLAHGHRVVVHARSRERAASLTDLADQGAEVVVGDLSRLDQTRDLADQVNRLGRMDAVIHNAGVYADRERNASPEGHPRTLAVNTLAPYLLTALVERPDRLVFLTSGMHDGGGQSLSDLDWTGRRWSGIQAYSDSKLYVTTLALALAGRWPEMPSNAVDPGWVPTRMGGPGAPYDLREGHRTQVWLATSTEPEAVTTGRVWFHRRPTSAPAVAADPDFQDRVLTVLAELTGTELPSR